MILNLLQLEWLKYRRNKVFVIFTIGYFIMLPGIMLIFKTMVPEAPSNTGAGAAVDMFSQNMIYEFPTVWKWTGYIGNWLVFFLHGFMGILLITTEYSYKTLRQSIINGMSRQQFFFGKVLAITAISLVATLFYLLVTLLFGFTHTDSFSSLYAVFGTEGSSYIWRFFLMTFAYMLMGFFFGLLFRNTGLAAVLYLCYIMFIELILRYAIHLNAFEHRSMIFYPANMINYLLPVPLGTSEAQAISNEVEFSIIPTYKEAALGTLVYCSLMLFACWRMLTRRDL